VIRMYTRLDKISFASIDRVFTPWTAAGLFLLFALAQPLGGLRVRVELPASTLAVALFAWRILPRLASSAERGLALLTLGASLLLQALPWITSPSAGSLYEFGWRASLVMLAWAFALSLLSVRTRGKPLFLEEHRCHRLLWTLLGTLAVGLVAAHFAQVDRYAVSPDEVLYLLQSRLLRQPGFTRPLEPALVPFFQTDQSYVLHGRMNGQYPPGWPLLLAMFNGVGLRWLAPVCMGVLAVGCTYLVGAEIRSSTVGLMSAALLATSPALVYLSASYWSHVATVAFCVLAAWLLLRAERLHPPGTRLLVWTLAGVVLGFATTIRPLTGAALAVSLWGWILVRRRVRSRDVLRMSFALVLGAAAPLGFLLYYNSTVTGSPFTFGYHLAQRGLNDLGFGRRGAIYWGESGEPQEVLVSLFTPVVAASHFFTMMRDASFAFAPGFILAPLLFLVSREKLRLPWGPVAVFLLLPAAHFFYYYTGWVFYSELGPFLLVGVAVLLVDLARKEGRLARHMLAFWIVGNTVLAGAQNGAAARQFRERLLPYFDGVAHLKHNNDKVLVFVRDCRDLPILFHALAWFNVDSFPGDVIVARDLGARDAELMKRWPDHRPFRVSEKDIDARAQRPTFVPLVDGSPLESC